MCFFFSSRRRHTRSVSAFLLNRSSDLTASRRNPTYQAGLRRDAVQPDIEAERKKRDEIEAGKSYCSRRFGGATCDDRSEERRVGKECRTRVWTYVEKKKHRRVASITSKR